MLERVAEFIIRYSMFQQGARVGVAVSGGVDSVCLLHVLRELAPRWDLRLAVLHLNHKLRGQESEGDEQFVRGLAEQFRLPVIVRSWERAPASESQGSANLEEAARDARLAMFTEAMTSGAIDRVALGHTRSDQAETVLFRFLRGAGTAGLAGIRPVTSMGIVRPLLGLDRAEIEAFLRERGIAWREDSTNASPDFARNRIRHSLLPLLSREWNPAIPDTLAGTAEWAQGEEAYWKTVIDRLASGLLTEREGAVLIRSEELRVLPVAAARRLIRHAIERVKGDLRGIDFGHVAAILDLTASSDGHGRFQAPGLDVIRSLDWLRIGKPGSMNPERRRYLQRVSVPATVEIPGTGGAIHLELVEKAESGDRVYNDITDWLEWRKLSGPLVLRNWRPGDQYQPVGKSGEEKIKTLFQEGRVPLWERGRWPVLLDGGVVIWARRFGPAAHLAANPGAEMVLAVRDTGGAATGRPAGPGEREPRGQQTAST